MKYLFILFLIFLMGCSSQPENVIYSDNFDGDFKKEFWEIRQNTQWQIIDGQLVGSPAPSEYQEMMKKKKDSHTGQWPIIRLLKIPPQFTCSMRLKLEGTKYEKNRPLLDAGHHINSFLFKEDSTRLKLKNAEILNRNGNFFPLNKWVDLKITLTAGKLIINIDGKEEVFVHPEISMHDHSEFTFKGMSYGRILFDSVKVVEIK